MSYLNRLLDALLGREQVAAKSASGVETTARVAAIEMDLRERDQRIAAMQKEYANLEAAGKRAASGAGAEQLEQLFKKLAPQLSNLAALGALAADGRDVAVADVLSLLRSLEKQFRGAGLETIGAVGERLLFDVALHQRMSGGSVSAGTEVTVCTPGYRFGGKVLLKAMVTAAEVAHE